MNTFRQVRLKFEIDQLSSLRQRIIKLRDDEDRAIAGLSPHGPGDQRVSDTLSEASAMLLAVIGKLDNARK